MVTVFVLAIGSAFASKSLLLVQGYQLKTNPITGQPFCDNVRECSTVGETCMAGGIAVRDTNNPTISCGNILRHTQ